MACSKDRYAATYVVAPQLGPPDCQVADFTDIQAAVTALPSIGGKIFVKAGTYPIKQTIRILASNVQIQGEGMGITNLVADATMTTSSAIAVNNPAVGSPLALLADTQKGDTTVTVSPADAATLTAGDYILLFSQKPVDSEIPTKHAGEVKQVVDVNALTGVITVDDQIYDAYRGADSAAMARITMLRNVTLSDFSITTQATVFTGSAAFTSYRFVDNLQIERVEAHHAYIAGISLLSVLNSKISDCYIHHISDRQPPDNVHYGIVVSAASQNVSITGCRFSHTRHAVTTGGTSGNLANGVQRNIVISNCTSMAADTAHFDTHDPAENVSYVGCVAIGGVPQPLPAGQEVVGFQMRGANSSIVGCSVLQAIGKGILIFEGTGNPEFHTGSDGATITGNLIAGVQSIEGTLGIGIHLDSSGTSRHTITGNVIKQCEGSAIRGEGGNNDVVVSGNVIDATNLVVPDASIVFHNAERITITGNKILNNLTGSPIGMKGSSNDWHIANNSFAQNNDDSPSPLSIDSTVINNSGYNPVGIIADPWRPTGDLTNDGGGSADPVSGRLYTVRQSPKTIIITGGAVTQIEIDGTPTGLSAGVFKLGIGETIAVTYDSLPTGKVVAD
jgi:Right handed beta helix region